MKPSHVAAAVLALAAIQPGEAAAVVGYPGSGKTRDTMFASASWRRSIVFDPYALRDRLNATRGNHDVHPWPGDLLSFADVANHPDTLDDRDLRIVVHPCDMIIDRKLRSANDPEVLGLQFSMLADMAWCTGGGIILVAEEAGLYSRSCAQLGQRIATGGRHGGVAMVALSQRLNRLHIDYRACMRILCAGQQNEPADMRAIAERCGDDYARRVATLPPGAPLEVWRSGAVESQS